jgi:Zn-dependent protease with chaperone function
LFADGGRCEVEDLQGFAALFPAGPGPYRLESGWMYAMMALILAAGLAVAAYRWGLPYLARSVADRIPDAMVKQMDRYWLDNLDDGALRASLLDGARRHAIERRVTDLILPPGAVRPQLVFRSSDRLGPNAFALPGGSVVILDGLVELADDDDEIVAVLAHEIGHVSRRHTLRQVLQASLVGLMVAWYLGDSSGLLAVAPSVLLQTRYSRDLERSADGFAIDVMRLNHIPPSRLADMLSKLQARQMQDAADIVRRPDSMLDYLSSHPASEERIAILRSQRL